MGRRIRIYQNGYLANGGLDRKDSCLHIWSPSPHLRRTNQGVGEREVNPSDSRQETSITVDQAQPLEQRSILRSEEMSIGLYVLGERLNPRGRNFVTQEFNFMMSEFALGGIDHEAMFSEPFKTTVYSP